MCPCPGEEVIVWQSIISEKFLIYWLYFYHQYIKGNYYRISLFKHCHLVDCVHSFRFSLFPQISIREARGLPAALSNFVFCQYSFWGQPEPIVVAPVVNPEFCVRDKEDGATVQFGHSKVSTNSYPFHSCFSHQSLQWQTLHLCCFIVIKSLVVDLARPNITNYIGLL